MRSRPDERVAGWSLRPTARGATNPATEAGGEMPRTIHSRRRRPAVHSSSPTAPSAPSTGHRSSMTSNQAARRHGPLLVRSARAVVLAVFLAVVGVVGGLGEVPAAGSATSGWLPPLEPLVVVHGFDPPAGPYAPGHRGVDLAAGVGQPVGSAADGVVSYAGRIAGVGVVAVVHGRIRTTYQPLEVTTTRGATVSAGDEIGRLDQAGSHCAPDPCLHWGAIIGDTYVDPLHLLNPGPSRLLPYWDVAARPAAPAVPDAAAGPAIAETFTRLRGADAAPVNEAADAAHRAGPARKSRPLPAGLALAIAALGAMLAGGVFVAVRRWVR